MIRYAALGAVSFRRIGQDRAFRVLFLGEMISQIRMPCFLEVKCRRNTEPKTGKMVALDFLTSGWGTSSGFSGAPGSAESRCLTASSMGRSSKNVQRLVAIQLENSSKLKSQCAYVSHHGSSAGPLLAVCFERGQDDA